MPNMRFLGGGSGGGREAGGPGGEDGARRRPTSSLRRDATPRPPGARDLRHVEELPPIPDKIYFRIGEVAHLVAVEPHVLRYWEHEFRSIRPTKSQRGQRVYSVRDVQLLRRIRGLLYEQGFTIAGAKKALRARGVEPHEANDPTLAAGQRARDALVAIRRDVEDLLRELGG